MNKIFQFRNQITQKITILLFTCCTFLVACSNRDDTTGNSAQLEAAASSEQDLNGVAQKGMFLEGTEVTAWQLDERGQRTGVSLSTLVEGSQGFYDLSPNWTGWTEIHVLGYYFDEFTGTTSMESIALTAIVNLETGENSKNINLFTHLQAARAQTLAAESVPMEAAAQEALEETQLLVGLGDVDPGQLDLTQGTGENAEKNAALLLFSGAFLAEGGDVFILDMGEQVKILDLAEKLIYLSGRNIKQESEGEGIEIQEVGLRPGEKLFEELLISGEEIKTPNEKVFKSNEEFLSKEALDRSINDLKKAIDENDHIKIKEILKDNVEGYLTKH